MHSENTFDWWNTRAFLIAMMAAGAVPLLWPEIPPLTDLPGHIGHYRVALDLAQSPYLRQYYDFHWTLVGNLGVDLLVMPLGRLIGLELAVKLIVLTIPPLTIGGMLLLAREIHGRVPATAILALPLAYSWPFQFGFVNYCLALMLTLYAAVFWLRLGRAGRTRLRAALFVAISLAIWLCHVMAWGVFGLAIFAFELIAARREGRSWPRSLAFSVLACLPLALPLVINVIWWSEGPEGVTGWTGGWEVKVFFLLAVLRNYHLILDLFTALVLYTAVAFGLLRDHLRIEPRLGVAALLVMAAFAVMPNVLLGAAYSDMRLVPFGLMLAILSLEPASRLAPRGKNAIALAATALFVLRMADQSLTYFSIDRAWQEQAAAIDRLPRGARIFALAAVGCSTDWAARRMQHLDGLAIARREAFTNGQWPMPGGKLLTVVYPAARGFDIDPSQFLWPTGCEGEGSRLDFVLEHLPRQAFDYLWLIDLDPARQPRDPGLIPVWRGPDRGVLYRIAR
jgi:hypothetical protein